MGEDVITLGVFRLERGSGKKQGDEMIKHYVPLCGKAKFLLICRSELISGICRLAMIFKTLFVKCDFSNIGFGVSL